MPKWKQLLEECEKLQVGLDMHPAEDSNVAHYARMQLTNALAQAQEILEAFASDEEKP
jgi:hypothetical protein